MEVTGLRGSDENKASGIAFVKSVPGGSGSCDDAGLKRAVVYAANSTVPKRGIFYVSDGGGTCGHSGLTEAQYWRETIDSVTAANNGTARIHSIQIHGSEAAADFMRELAEKNGGTFHQLNL